MIFVFLIVSASTLFYILYKRMIDYWKVRGVPYIKAKFIYGNSKGLGKEFHTCALMESVLYELKTKGPIGGIHISSRPVAIITDLDLVKTVLVKDFNYFPNRGIFYNLKDDPISGHISNIENQHWKNIRSKLTPAFTTGKLKVMFNNILEISDTFMTTIARESAETGSVELKDILSRFTCDVIGDVAFGVNCNSLNDKDAKFYKMAVKSMDSFDFIQRLVWMGYKRIVRALRFKLTPDDVSDFYTHVVKSIVDFRSQNGVDGRVDLMNILIDMMTTDKISLDEVTAQAFFYFIAGYETTSTVLTFCI